MRQILCAASINYHMLVFINFLSYVFCVKINKELRNLIRNLFI